MGVPYINNYETLITWLNFSYVYTNYKIIRIPYHLNTSDAVFPIGIRSQSSCAILFTWKRKNKVYITINFKNMYINSKPSTLLSYPVPCNCYKIFI